jgi:hypothetical protein
MRVKTPGAGRRQGVGGKRTGGSPFRAPIPLPPPACRLTACAGPVPRSGRGENPSRGPVRRSIRVPRSGDGVGSCDRWIARWLGYGGWRRSGRNATKFRAVIKRNDSRCGSDRGRSSVLPCPGAVEARSRAAEAHREKSRRSNQGEEVRDVGAGVSRGPGAAVEPYMASCGGRLVRPRSERRRRLVPEVGLEPTPSLRWSGF